MAYAFGFLGLAATVLSADYIHEWYIEKRRIPRMVEVFERGSIDLKVVGNYFLVQLLKSSWQP